MPWAAELHYYDPVAQAEESAVFMQGAGVAFTDAPYGIPGLVKWGSPTQKITFDQNGVISMSTDQGSIEITNLPDDFSQPGPLDIEATRIFQGRMAKLYWVDGNLWSARILMDQGIVEQPIINWSTGSTVQATLLFQLRDPRSSLTADLQPNLFAGTNAHGAGVEGSASDLKGKPKPIMYGTVSNIPGVRVNDSVLVYQVADKAVSIDCCRDGGLQISQDVVFDNLNNFMTNATTKGGYFDFYAGPEGTFARLGGTPRATVTFDAHEGDTSADRTAAQIWKRMRTERCGTDEFLIDDSSVAAADALDSGETGYWFGDQVTQLDALNQVLSGFTGFEVLSQAGLWKIQKLTVPAADATTVVDLVPLTTASALTAKSRKMSGQQFVRPDYTPNGSPPWQVNVQWGENYQVMSVADFNGAAIQRLIDKFALQYRTTTVQDTTVWNPANRQGPWIDAPSFTVRSGYQAIGDGTCPAADAEAARLMAMFGKMRGQWQVSFIPVVGDRVLAGDAVSFTLFQYDLSASALFRVLQSSLVVDQNGSSIGLVIGFQRLSGDT